MKSFPDCKSLYLQLAYFYVTRNYDATAAAIICSRHSQVSDKIGLHRYVAVQLLIDTRLYCSLDWTHWSR